MIKIEIGENEQNQRLDRFLRKYLSEAPLAYIYKAVRKDVKVNGKRQTREYMLALGDVISLYLSDADLEKFHPNKRKLALSIPRTFRIAYEDENLLICEKPFGLLTHGDQKEKKNHLANQVLGYLTQTGAYDASGEKTFSPAPVNRLDRNTTGLVIFAKNYPALQAFNEMLRDHTCIRKFYNTIVCGEFTEELYLQDKMVKDTAKNQSTVVAKDGEAGKEILTIARPKEAGREYSFVEVEILTGRTHQIRVHMASAGYPLIGDPKYGDPKTNRKLKESCGLTTQLLHAARLEFRDCPPPYDYLNGKSVTAELPKRFQKIKKQLF